MTPFRHLPPDLYIHGQPTPEQIAALPSQGIASVINLRGTGEDSGFDEPAAVAAAGLAYHALPVAGPQDLTADTVARFSDLLAQARSKGPVLIHCASANRVGALLALEKGWLHGLASNDAVEIGRQAGLTGLEPVVSRLLEDGPN